MLLVSAAALAAVAVELSLAKDAHGIGKARRATLALGSVSASGLVAQVIFALHYAHECHAPDEDGDPATLQQGGLQFPDDDAPDDWDFIHVVIGVASRTADVGSTSMRMGRISTVHGLVAFTLDTVILALTINILAGLLW